ncbi:hypothetical protein ASE14_13380 [Agromyces sp. Root81]|uniref:DUF418 domain-containing protein n=1 Tax=Agromyces sp. Root81 TaxID=1736601 RepID=UPI0006F9245C|nr:DUF418 domain-containing protein [Agromyces sp. Root81]KRC61800.1 hypothetical protein ASE14_13380 [Agromyces sp. Root81]
MATASPSTSVTSTASPDRVRAVAPDVARGVMLLLIALAHAPAFVADWGTDWLDQSAEFIRALVAENQARSMFIFLFGYGLGQFAASRAASGEGWGGIRGVLHRRGLVFLVIGLLNTALLVPIDIIAVYGIALLGFAWLVRSSDRVLLWSAAVALPFAITLIAWQTERALAAQALGAPETMVPYMATDYLAHVVSQLATWLPETILAVPMVVPGMALGIWCARRRILDEPARHVRTLRIATIVLLGAALVMRLPEALAFAGVWSVASPGALWGLAVAHTIGGYAGGIGLACAVGLFVVHAGSRPGRITTALAALGQRSLTFYLAQSAVWLALFYPFTLDLADDVGFAGACLIAVVVWVLSVLAADLLRRRGLRGPMEWLTRRLTATPWRRSARERAARLG